MTRRTAIRTCPLCEATCGLVLDVDGEEVSAVRGDRDDVFSRGYLCPKGARLADLDADPDRLHTPRIRRGGELVEVSWDEAYAEVAARLPAIMDEHGRDAVAVYLGNPNAHNLDGQLYLAPLLRALRTRNLHSATSVDQLPKHVTCGYLFGDPSAIPVPDIDRTDLIVVFGGNPAVSNGSVWTAPGMPRRLRALRQRGGQLIVVDPRRTRTAEQADQHVPIVPGTDALLLAALVHALDDEGLVDVGDHLRPHVVDLDAVLRLVAPYTPERVADRCGVPAATIRELARTLAAARAAAVYGRLGTSTVRTGTVATYLIDVLNVLTGNLDRPGGAMFPRPAHHRRVGRPFRHGRWGSRVRALPETMGELPVAGLLDEIETPGEGQVRALITVAGNPALSIPNSDRVDRALRSLDLIIAVDFHVNATTRHADVILPPPAALHRPHYDLALYAVAIRNVANFSPPVFELPDDRPHEWEILLTLAAIVGGAPVPVDTAAVDEANLHTLVDRLVADPSTPWGPEDRERVLAALGDEPGPERQLDLLLRAGPYRDERGEPRLTLDVLREAPHGVDLGPLEPRIAEVLATERGRIELAPPAIVDHLPDALDALLDEDVTSLRLIGRRHLRTNNSWSHNVPGLSRGDRLAALMMHPEDAGTRGIADGDSVTVRSAVGQVEAVAEVTDEVRPGVVSLPHGFGHAALDGIELRVAATVGGPNSNVLSDDLDVDPISGVAVLNGIAVEVRPSA